MKKEDQNGYIYDPCVVDDRIDYLSSLFTSEEYCQPTVTHNNRDHVHNAIGRKQKDPEVTFLKQYRERMESKRNGRST